MTLFLEALEEYRLQLQKGAVQAAYRGLMKYMGALRTALKERRPDYFVSGGLYYGFMDMTYFSYTPESLQRRKLKIAVVFVHEAFRFEVWLAAANKQVQTEYWKRIQEKDWTPYRVVPTIQGYDSILEHTLAAAPDFGDLPALTEQIAAGTLRFIQDVEEFFA